MPFKFNFHSDLCFSSQNLAMFYELKLSLYLPVTLAAKREDLISLEERFCVVKHRRIIKYSCGHLFKLSNSKNFPDICIQTVYFVYKFVYKTSF